MNRLRELVELLAKSLVDNPSGVIVREITGESTTVFELRVDKEDIGKVIGKQGRTAQALRAVLTAAGAKIRLRVILEILD